MKVSDDLFKLIKSLDQSEKRYFKIFAGLHIKDTGSHSNGYGNNYVRLFDAIDKQNIANGYNEDLIKEQFRNDRFSNQLHVAKNYLYHSILKSLRGYHSEKDKVSELRDMLKNIQILYDKSLFNQCEKLLIKAKKIAVKYERYSDLLEIFDWEKTFAKINAYMNVSEGQLKNLFKEQSEIISKLQNTNEYWLLSIRAFFLRKKYGVIRDKKEFKKFNEIMNHPLLVSDNMASTFRSKIFFHNIKGLIYLTNNDHKNLLRSCRNFVELQESHPELMKHENYKNYIPALNNLLLVQIELNKYNDALDTIKKLRNLETRSLSMQSRIFVTSYDTELNLYLKNGEFEKGTALVKGIEEGLNSYKGKINKESEVLFYYNISYLFFGIKDFNNALKWINEIINDRDLKIREDIQCYSRILNLFIHYELKNYNLIEYSIKSTQRYLSSKHNLDKFEISVLNYFRKLISAKNKEEEKEICEDWKRELSKVLRVKDSFEMKALEYFDFISWLESKIHGKSFMNVVKQKSGK
jgi:hypothetical protein